MKTKIVFFTIFLMTVAMFAYSKLSHPKKQPIETAGQPFVGAIAGVTAAAEKNPSFEKNESSQATEEDGGRAVADSTAFVADVKSQEPRKALWNDDPFYAEVVNLWHEKKIDEALVAVRALSKAESERYDIKTLHAEIALSIGNVVEARSVCDDVFELAPMDVAVLEVYVACAKASPRDQEHMKKAVENLANLAQMSSNPAKIQLARAEIAMEQGKLTEAKVLIDSVAMSAEFELERVDLTASMLQRQGDQLGAEDLYRQTADSLRAAAPANRPHGWENFFFNMIEQLLNNGKTEEARRLIVDLREEGSQIDLTIFDKRIDQIDR